MLVAILYFNEKNLRVFQSVLHGGIDVCKRDKEHEFEGPSL